MNISRMGSNIGLGSVAVLLALAGAVAQAQPAGAPGARGEGPTDAWVKRGGGPGERQGGLMRRLDLSEDQRVQIAGIRERSRAEGSAAREQMQALREEIRASSEAGGYNETQVRGLIESRSQLLVDNMLRRVRMQSEIAAVLTPEQRAQMAELRGKRGGQGRRVQRPGG
jgi:Spy/CpxP family protein refolding chaperone